MSRKPRQPTLFTFPQGESPPPPKSLPAAPAPARVVRAERNQLELKQQDLDSLIAADHRARTFWRVLGTLDLQRFYEGIEARGSEPGRLAIDPQILIALWLFATAEGVGSGMGLIRFRGHPT